MLPILLNKSDTYFQIRFIGEHVSMHS